MANSDYTISVGLDTTKALAGIKALEQKLGTLESINKKLAKPDKLKVAERKAYVEDIKREQKALEAKKKSEVSAYVEDIKRTKAKAAAQAKADKVVHPTGKKKGENDRVKEIQQTIRKGIAQRKQQIRLEGQVTAQAVKYKTALRSVNNQILTLDKSSKKYAENKNRLRGIRYEILAQKKALSNATIETQSDLRKHAKAWTHLKNKVSETSMSVRRANKQFSIWSKLVKGFKQNIIQYGLSALSAGVIYLTGALYSNSVEWENLRIQMQASFGSAEAGAKQMEFLTETAKTLGLDVKELADGYAKIGATGTMVGMSTETIKEVFLGAAEAATAFGLSVDDTKGVMRAFSQMLGKGQVMAEELKQQLGDRFPVAMGVMAKAIGKTVPELIELMEAGQLSTEEVIKFSAELRKNVRESGAYQKALKRTEAFQNRMNLALSLAGQSFMGGAMNEALKDAMTIVKDLFTDITPFLGLLGDVIGGLLWAGLQLIKVVLEPIGKALKGIGLLYEFIKDIVLIDPKEVQSLNMLSRIIRGIYLLFVDVFLITKMLGKAWDSLFDGTAAMHVFDMFDAYFEKVASFKEATGFQTLADVQKTQAQAKEAGKGGVSVKGDLNVQLPPGTTPDQAPSFIDKIINESLGNVFSGQMADA